MPAASDQILGHTFTSLSPDFIFIKMSKPLLCDGEWQVVDRGDRRVLEAGKLLRVDAWSLKGDPHGCKNHPSKYVVAV